MLVPFAGTATGTVEQLELLYVRSKGSYWKKPVEYKDIPLLGMFREVSRLGSCPFTPEHFLQLQLY